MEQELQKLEVEIPANAEFGQNRMEQYEFTIHMQEQGNKMIDGKISCNYYEDKTIKRVSNEMITYEKISEKEIMSEQEAYQQILDGEFKGFTIDEIKSISIKGVELEYKLDSKGYYVPIYKFDVLLNGNKSTIYIKAIK